MKKSIRYIFFIFMSVFMVFLITGCTLIKSTSSNESNTQEESTINAYEEAVKDGYSGSLTDWLKYIISAESYNSIYELAVEKGVFDGTLEEFIASLKGEKGDKGDSSSTDIENGSAIAVNSIVSIVCNFTATVTARDWWGRTQTYTSDYTSAGSGVIIEDEKEDGIAYIVTNYHVVYDSSSDSGVSTDISIMLYGMEFDDYKISASYVGGSLTYDIAVLKIESDIYKNSGAYSATISNSSNLSIGMKVIAIGNPEAQGISVTSGIVSVPSETIKMTAADEKSQINMRVVRIDAAVNSGNSGGGLFDSNGKLIGIVNAKIVDEDIEGICYAIPINVAYAVAKKIINTCDGVSTTTIKKAVLGVTTKITSSKSSYDSSTLKTQIIQTIGISEVSSESSADGVLEVDDIIESIEYKNTIYQINGLYDIEDVMLMLSKGDTITINYIRDNNSNKAVITLQNETSVK